MKTARILLLAGQSNAVGVGYTAYLPRHFSPKEVAELRAGYDTVKINYVSHDIRSHGFVRTTVGCTEATKDTVGPELGMAAYLYEKDPETPYFIVKCAFGGRSLRRDFLSPSNGAPYVKDAYATVTDANGMHNPDAPGWAYNELVRLASESIALLEQEGYQPQILGFCWMQGENEACEEQAAAQYGEMYRAFLRDLTADLAPYMEKCRFVDAGISEIWRFYQVVNRQKEDYARSCEDRVYIDTVAAGLTTKYEPEEAPDVAHYDVGSIIKLGRLLAQAVVG